jgi:hypothetical protein
MVVKKKKKDAPLQEIGIDAAVQAYLGRSAQAEVDARREREMSLSKSKREKRKKDKARNRVWYDLPGEIIDRIAEIAAEHQIPKSQLAAFLLDRAIREYDAGEIDLTPYLRPSRIPRFSSFLILPGEVDSGWSISGWTWKNDEK